jgi:HlyD family secretion protein
VALRPGDEVQTSTVLARMVPASSPLLDERARAEALARVSAAEAARRQSEVTVERGKVAFDLARAEAERIKALTTSGAMTPSLLDKAEGEVKIRASEVEAARLGAQIAAHELAVARSAATRVKPGKQSEESFEVTSPVDGRVLRVHQESEGIVAAGTPLLEVGDTRHLEVVVDVLTTDAVLLRPGMKATIERWSAGAAMGESQEGQPLEAHLRSIEPAAFTRVSALGVEEQRVNIVLDIDAPQERWAALGDGYRVDAAIVVREIPSAVLVPLGAIFRKGGAWATFVVSGGKALLRPVEIGARSGATVEI